VNMNSQTMACHLMSDSREQTGAKFVYNFYNRYIEGITCEGLDPAPSADAISGDSKPEDALCGVQAPGNQPRIGKGRIVGGEDAKPHSWPWQIGFYQYGQFFCGGSLLSADVILTAAHCFERSGPAPGISIKAGDHNNSRTSLQTDEETINVAKVLRHPEYNSETTENDIALVKLEKAIKLGPTKRTICLPPQGHHVAPKTECVISGWGSTGASPLPSVLQEATVPVLSDEVCNDADHYNGQIIRGRMFCAGRSTGGVDACQGDSGGPLVCQSNSVWFLQGITSWGNGCAEAKFPGVYTKVANYVEWISTNSKII